MPIPHAAKGLRSIMDRLGRNIVVSITLAREGAPLWHGRGLPGVLRENIALDPLVPAAKRMLIQARDLPPGIVPQVDDDVLIGQERWHVTQAQLDTAQAAWILSLVQIG